jgi:hypothetical protein
MFMYSFTVQVYLFTKGNQMTTACIVGLRSVKYACILPIYLKLVEAYFYLLLSLCKGVSISCYALVGVYRFTAI